MPGRNLPPRYRVITRDSDMPTAPDTRRDRGWGDDAFEDVPAPSPDLDAHAPSWPLIGLFLFAAAVGGAGMALLGLIPDVLL